MGIYFHEKQTDQPCSVVIDVIATNRGCWDKRKPVGVESEPAGVGTEKMRNSVPITRERLCRRGSEGTLGPAVYCVIQ